MDEAIRQLGDPAALAESYLSAVPLVPAPHTPLRDRVKHLADHADDQGGMVELNVVAAQRVGD